MAKQTFRYIDTKDGIFITGDDSTLLVHKDGKTETLPADHQFEFDEHDPIHYIDAESIEDYLIIIAEAKKAEKALTNELTGESDAKA